MNLLQACGIVEGIFDADDNEQVIEAWQFLHDSGYAYTLPGFYGRTVQGLIEQGVVTA